MDNNKSVFAQNLKYQMAINHKTRREVCEALGFSYYTFSDWVNGKKYPRMDKVEILANYFGCKKSDLIEDKKEKPTVDDGLSDEKRALMQFAQNLPEDKAALALRLLKSIVEGD